MSSVQLTSTIEVESTQIAAATLERKGSKISANVVTVASGDAEDLRVPEDSLIVRLLDGAEFVIRGEAEAQQAFEQLRGIKEREKLSFELASPERT